jgi:hypothetical protein
MAKRVEIQRKGVLVECLWKAIGHKPCLPSTTTIALHRVRYIAPPACHRRLGSFRKIPQGLEAQAILADLRHDLKVVP